MLELDTPHRQIRAHLHQAGDARGALVLGHGAGAGAPDLVLATEVANGLGIAVALVEHPYRVAGRRSTPAAHLLLLWTEVVKQPRREGAVVPHQESARETTVYGKRESR